MLRTDALIAMVARHDMQSGKNHRIGDGARRSPFNGCGVELFDGGCYVFGKQAMIEFVFWRQGGLISEDESYEFKFWKILTEHYETH